MEMTTGRTVRLKLFLEGVEVSVSSALVTGGIMQPCSATIAIPAARAGMELKARTLVHLFYLDEAKDSPATAKSRGVEEIQEDPTRWRMLFAGELVRKTYSKRPGDRVITLICQDFSSYWHSAKLFWGRKKTADATYKKIMFMGATHLHRGRELVDSSNDLVKLLSGNPSTLPGVQGLLGGIIALLESTTGVYDNKEAKNFRGVNDFLSQAELRLHLTRMIGASEQDDSSAAFLNTSQFKRYLRQISKGIKSTSSYMELVTLLLSKVYHTWSSVPAPPYIPADSSSIITKQVVGVGGAYTGSGELGRLKAAIARAFAVSGAREDFCRDRSAKYVWVADTYLTRPVGASGRTTELATDEHERYNRDMVRSQLLTYTPESITRIAETYYKSVLDRNGPNTTAERKALDVVKGLQLAAEAIGFINRVGTAGSTELAQQGFPYHTRSNISKIHSLLSNAAKLTGVTVARPTKTVEKEVDAASRLNAHLFMPDLYMVPPPRCNVIFPDHHTGITFQHDLVNEITRLALSGRTRSGKDKKQIYVAPNAEILGGPKAEDMEEAARKGTSFIMAHEIYTGIVAAVEGLGDNDVFKKINSTVKRSEVREGVSLDKVEGQARYSPQDHLQRAANFVFFEKRLRARVGSVSCRFAPQLVPGLPGLVLDNTGDGTEGIHIIGMIETIRHNVNAQGLATTTVTLSKCRRHDEEIELYGDGDVDETGRITVEKLKSRNTKRVLSSPEFHVEYRGLDAEGRAILPDNLDPAGVKGYTHRPASGASYKVRIHDYRPEKTTTADGIFINRDGVATSDGHLPSIYPDLAKEIPPERIDRTRGAVVLDAVDSARRAAAGLGNAGGALAQGGGAELGIAGQGLGVRVDVVEYKKTSIKKKVRFSFEETTTPPWFASIFLPHNIGTQFYEPMLGCTSVLDATELEKSEKAQLSENGKRTRAGDEKTSELYVDVGGREGDEAVLVQIPAEYGTTDNSVYLSVEALSRVWRALTDAGSDIDRFIDNYCKRNYADIVTMMGNVNPYLIFRGNLTRQSKAQVGFHGNAYGAYADLEDVAGEPLNPEPLAVGPNGAGDPRRVSAGVDPRRGRYQAVIDYFNVVADLALAEEDA